MAVEQKWLSVAPQLFTVDGSSLGIITIANTAGFKVKQRAVISATGLPDKPVQIKRVISPTQMIVGPEPLSLQPAFKQQGNQLLSVRTDLSLYTMASGAFVYAPEQDKARLTVDDIWAAVYDQEPTVAIRTTPVDQYGQYYTDDNPLPVLFEGSISIGAVEVKGTNGNYLEPNTDGSIDVVDVGSVAATPTIFNISVPTANVEVSQSLPSGTKKFSIQVRNSTALLQFAFAVGQSATNFIRLVRGASYEVTEILTTSLTIYFQTNNPSQIVEIIAWT